MSVPPSPEVAAQTQFADARTAIHDMLEEAAYWPAGYQAMLADLLTRAGQVMTFVAFRVPGER